MEDALITIKNNKNPLDLKIMPNLEKALQNVNNRLNYLGHACKPTMNYHLIKGKPFEDKYLAFFFIISGLVKSIDLLLPFNVINLSNNPSLKDINFKQIVKINNNYNNNTNSFTKKINQGTNTIYSIIKKVKNKNKRNIFNIKKKQFFPEIDDNKYGENFNSSTIRSKEKKKKSNQIHDTNSKKVDKKLFFCLIKTYQSLNPVFCFDMKFFYFVIL